MAHETAAFDENVRQLIHEWRVPGLAIAVVKGNEIHAKVPCKSVLVYHKRLHTTRVTELFT